MDSLPSVGATAVRESLFENDWSLRGKRLERLGPRQRLVHVAVLSGLGLFLELLFIRWLESQVRHLVYVKNLPLVASVLGLGLGYALAGRRRSFFPLAILLCAILLSVGVHLGDVGVTEDGVPNLFGPASLEANIPAQVATSTSQLLAFFATIVGIFSLTVLAMVPFGQIAGSTWRDYTRCARTARMSPVRSSESHSSRSSGDIGSHVGRSTVRGCSSTMGSFRVPSSRSACSVNV